jgi:hypothetical protein
MPHAKVDLDRASKSHFVGAEGSIFEEFRQTANRQCLLDFARGAAGCDTFGRRQALKHGDDTIYRSQMGGEQLGHQSPISAQGIERKPAGLLPTYADVFAHISAIERSGLSYEEERVVLPNFRGAL